MITIIVGGTALFGWLVAVGAHALVSGQAGMEAFLPAATRWALFGIIGIVAVWLWERTRRGREFFHPALAFPAAYAVWFAMGSLDLVDPVPDTRMWDPMPAGILLMAAMGFIGYRLGVAVLPNSGPLVAPAAVGRAFSVWDPSRARIVGGGLLALVLGSYGALVGIIGVPILADDPSVARLGTNEQAEIFAVFYSGALAFVPMSLARMWATPAPPRGERRVILLANALVAAMLLSLGSRGLVLQPALLALLTAHYLHRRIPLAALGITGVVALVFLSVVGLWRDLTSFGPGHVAKLVSWGFPLWSLPFTYIYTYVRDPVATFREITELIPRFIDYQYGRVFASPLVTALPGFQESSDLFFKRILRNEFVGVGRPATLLGSLYADLGAAGVFVGLVLFGLLSMWIYLRFVTNPTPIRCLLYIWIAHTALLSMFSSLFPYPTTVFVPVLMTGLCVVMVRTSTLKEQAMPKTIRSGPTP